VIHDNIEKTIVHRHLQGRVLRIGWARHPERFVHHFRDRLNAASSRP
jgi:hypothetical protein